MKTRTLALIGLFAVAAVAAVAVGNLFDAPALAGGMILANAPFPLAAIVDPATGRFNVNRGRPIMYDDGSVRLLATNARGEISGTVLVHNDAFAANAPGSLRHEQWRAIDAEVVRAGADRLVGVGDLEARGLVHNLGSIGVTVSSYEKVSEMTEADVSMDGITEGEKDTINFEIADVAVPIVHKDFDINERRLIASRLTGEALDVTAAGVASRVVAERFEDMLFSTTAIKIRGGATVYGYLNHPNRNTLNMATAWTTASPDEILDDIRDAAAAARADHFYGPFVLYIPGPYQAILDKDYLVGDAGEGITVTTKTIRQRIMELSDIAEIRVADRLSGNNVILVQLTRDVVDLAKAQGISTINWSMYGGMQTRFKVLGIMVPRVKSTYDGESGVVHIRPD